MRASPPPSTEPGIQRVSNIELFFDLVFVFTLTQLTGLVVHPHDLSDYVKAILVFMTLMWIYVGYAWLTSNIAIQNLSQRLLLFTSMASFSSWHSVFQMYLVMVGCPMPWGCWS